MSQDTNKLIDKVRKLIAKAESTDNQKEAEIFMGKANSLLLQHNLTMSEVSKEDRDGITESDSMEFGKIKEEGNWESSLASTIARHNLCQSITHKMQGVKGGSISIVGTAENVEIAIYLFEAARRIIRRLSKDAYNSLRKEAVSENPGLKDLELQKARLLPYRMPWIRSYLKGAVCGLHDKLEEEKRSIINQSQQVEQSYGLMVVENDQAIEKYLESQYEDLKSASSRKLRGDAEAFNKGKEDGRGIQLNKGVGGDQKSPKLIGN